MSSRTNTAKWIENRNMWRIMVQKNGERKSFYSSKPGRTGQREANAKADAWLAQESKDPNMIVSVAYEEYMESLRKNTSYSHYRPAESRWSVWILPQIGRRPISTLTEKHLNNVISNAYAAGKSKKTLMNIRADLTSFLKFCRSAQYTTLRPESLTISRGARTKGKTILQPVDVQKLMTISTTIHNRKTIEDPFIHFYRLALLTGMRPGEILGLKWSDIHGNCLWVQRSINTDGEITRGKNSNAVRPVPLSTPAIEEIEAQRKLTGRQTYLFPDTREEYILVRWHKYCEVNEITPVTLYELRHTFVSIAQSMPEAHLKSVVGHSENMDTFGIYAHYLDGQDEQIRDNLNRLFTVFR